jgi:hypothetical protein
MALLLAVSLIPNGGALAAETPMLVGGTAASASAVEGIVNALRESVCNWIESIEVVAVPDFFEGPVPSIVDPNVLGLMLEPTTRMETWTVIGCGSRAVAMLVLSYDWKGTEHYHVGTRRGWYDGP